MRIRVLIVAGCILAASALALGQARVLINTASPRVNLPNAPGEEVVLGSVFLGRQRSFSMFNVQVSGTIKPDPDLNGASFQLRILICDQPDCSGQVRSGARMLQDGDSAAPAQLIATKSFGISSHNSGPVVLSDYHPGPEDGSLYLAVALKVLHSAGSTPFTGTLSLLRIEAMP